MSDIGDKAAVPCKRRVHLCREYRLNLCREFIVIDETLDHWRLRTIWISNDKTLLRVVVENGAAQESNRIRRNNDLDVTNRANLVGEPGFQVFVETEVVTKVFAGGGCDRESQTKRFTIVFFIAQFFDDRQRCGGDLNDRVRCRWDIVTSERTLWRVERTHGFRLPSAEMTTDPYRFLPLDRETYLTTFRSHSEQVHSLLATHDLDRPVPTCGEWNLAALGKHLGTVYRWAALAIATADTPDRSAIVGPESAPTLSDWFRESAEIIDAALSTLDPEAPTWHPFAPPRRAGLWIRRLAHETAIHLVDTQLACEVAPSLTPEFSSDGIDEYLTVALPRVLSSGGTPPTTSLHIHCTNTAGEWLVAFSGDEMMLTREHAKGDAALRGDAEAILVDLWGRRGVCGEIDIAGDPAAAQQWLDLGGN